MKGLRGLFLGIALLSLAGIFGFFYRNIIEHPHGGVQVACTLEAKLCPDGTSVGRTGPSCSFATCPLPNVENTDLGISFVLPAGYVAANATGTDPSLVAAYEKPSLTQGVSNRIAIRRYLLDAGQTAEMVMVSNTIYAPSGKTAASMKAFTPVIIGGKTFYEVDVERFEGQVQSTYYLPRAADVLRFDVVEHDVAAWTDPKLLVANLPEHQALTQMLRTLQTR